MRTKKKATKSWSPARRFAFKLKKNRQRLIATGKDVTNTELRRREATKDICPHRRTNSDGSFQDSLNIKWMRHSNDLIMGVCGTCLSQFDCRNPQDLQWFLKDTRGRKFMALAVATQEDIAALAPKPEPYIRLETQEVPSTRWQKFVGWFKRIFS
jgi:hypothetical protein